MSGVLPAGWTVVVDVGETFGVVVLVTDGLHRFAATCATLSAAALSAAHCGLAVQAWEREGHRQFEALFAEEKATE